MVRLARTVPPSPVAPNTVFSTNSVIPVIGPVLYSVLLSLSSSSEESIRIKARWNDNNKFIQQSVNNNNNNRFYMMAVHIRGYVRT